MKRVHFIHWNEAEARVRAARIAALGYRVERTHHSGKDAFRRCRATPPDAIVIDLSRLPSHGIEVALSLWQTKSMRAIPIVFVGGDDQRIARTRLVLPAAAFCRWPKIGAALKRAIANPRQVVGAAPSILAGYSGTPLPKKLGMKPGCTVALLGAPPGFMATLGEIPDGVKVQKSGSRADLILWFLRSSSELKRDIRKQARRLGEARIWLIWPKKTSPLAGDITQNDVREIGLASGLVDYKVCAVDKDWSGLLFKRRSREG